MNQVSQAPTILIVDDQVTMRDMLRDFIGRAFPDYAILEAADGTHAMQVCTDRRPRLVLMDVRLPDANGIELTARIKAAMPAIPVIVVSYLSGQVYVEQALAAGASAYVNKDCLIPDLIPAITNALRILPDSHGPVA